MKTKEIKDKFIKDFWKWFYNYHRERYAKEGKELVPSIKYHTKAMKFDNYAWDWVALFIHKNYKKKGI